MLQWKAMGCKIQPKPLQIHSSASSSLQPISPKHETEILLYDTAQTLRNSLDSVSWGNKFLISFLWEEKNHNRTHLLKLQPHPLQNHCSFNLYSISDSKQQKGSSVQQHAVPDRTTQVPPTEWRQLERSQWHLVSVLQWYFHFSSDYITWEAECICWFCRESGNTFIFGGSAGREWWWRHKWNCTLGCASQSWGICPMAAVAGKHLACSCLHTHSQLCNP